MTTMPTVAMPTAAMYQPNTLDRADVTVSRDGWVTEKEFDSIVGHVQSDTNHMGRRLWRAQAGDVSAWSWLREDAVSQVLEIHNAAEKARAWDLLVRRTR